MEEYYKVLELQFGASIEEIKKARKELLQVWHPDRFCNNPELARRAQEKTKLINDASDKLIRHLRSSQSQTRVPDPKNYSEVNIPARHSEQAAKAAEEQAREAREKAANERLTREYKKTKRTTKQWAAQKQADRQRKAQESTDNERAAREPETNQRTPNDPVDVSTEAVSESLRSVSIALGLIVLVAGFGAIMFLIRVNTRSIREIDFRNYTYATIPSESVTVSNGKYERPFPDYSYYSVDMITYGDLTGDGKEDAAIVTNESGGGSGMFSRGMIFTLEYGVVKLLTEFKGGDRGLGGIHNVAIIEGLLVVERYDPGGRAYEEVYIDRTIYRWNGGQLIQIGNVQRRRRP